MQLMVVIEVNACRMVSGIYTIIVPYMFKTSVQDTIWTNCFCVKEKQCRCDDAILSDRSVMSVVVKVTQNSDTGQCAKLLYQLGLLDFR